MPEGPAAGSRSATVLVVPTIPQKELRNNVGEVLRRAEAGEEFTITVAGRPVAELGPARRRRWVSGPDLTRVWQTPAPRTLDADLDQFPGELADPFA
jgi:prevent-host-death family protein